MEQISMMKPKGQTELDTGLLEYLEDIIGTDKCGGGELGCPLLGPCAMPSNVMAAAGGCMP